MTIPSQRRLHNTAFVLVVPLYAIQHEWVAGEESVGQVGGACGVWLITRGRVVVETPRGSWNLEAGSAFVFMLPGERRVFTPEGASWLSVGLRSTAYEAFDLAASLPLPAVWKPQNEEWNVLRSCAETLAHAWEAPHFSTVDSRTYSGYISRQRSIDLERDASTALLVEGMARALFALCWRKLGESSLESVLGQRIPTWMPAALVAMRENPGIGVEELAHSIGLSRRQLGRDFQSYFGAPPREFLNRRRLEAARQLLETSDFSLTEIAHQTGFSAVAHFKRAFKAAFGVPPETYRRHSRREYDMI